MKIQYAIHPMKDYSPAVRWILDQGSDIALRGTGNAEQISDLNKMWNRSLKKQDIIIINNLINTTVSEPVRADLWLRPDTLNKRNAPAPPVREYLRMAETWHIKR